ncbi:unnamed protein product [Coregonus sp. 'balchen']|nr:unnamed protein product [Coregonus sp. 'balchen']
MPGAPPEFIHHPDYNKELTQFLPCTIMLKKPPGAQLLITLLLNLFVVPDSDAHRAGLQEGDQVQSVNEVDFQDIAHSRIRDAVEILKTAREILTTVRFFPYSKRCFHLLRHLILRKLPETEGEDCGLGDRRVSRESEKQ